MGLNERIEKKMTGHALGTLGGQTTVRGLSSSDPVFTSPLAISYKDKASIIRVFLFYH